MSTLGEEFPKEQKRVRELLTIYEGLGGPGIFGAEMLRNTLTAAEKAAVSGDGVAILRCFEDLKRCA